MPAREDTDFTRATIIGLRVTKLRNGDTGDDNVGSTRMGRGASRTTEDWREALSRDSRRRTDKPEITSWSPLRTPRMSGTDVEGVWGFEERTEEGQVRSCAKDGRGRHWPNPPPD